MGLMLNLSLFLASCAVLIISGGMLVRSLTKLSYFLKISQFIIGFVLVAVSTSLPELFVGISAALSGNAALALGNVIGSNIANLTLVTGIAVLLGRGLKVTHDVVRNDAYWMVMLAVLPIVLMLIGNELSRLDGVILLLTLAAYVWHLIKIKSKYHESIKDSVSRWGVLGYFIMFVSSFFLLFYAAKFVVEFGSALAIDLSLPQIFVGLFFLALGTSLPELIFESRAILAKASNMALGDLIGSVMANSTLVLGVTAIISPIYANFFLFLTSSVFMIIVCFMFAVFLESGDGISWKEGLVLLMMYVLFLLVSLNLQEFYMLNGV